MNTTGQSLTLRIIGAACGAAGFVVLGVGGQFSGIIGAGLIGVGSVLIAAGS